MLRIRKIKLQNTKKTSDKSNGFSLVEVLIGASLLVFVIVGLCQTLCLTLVLKQKADWHRVSSEILSLKIEKLKGLNPEDEELKAGHHAETTTEPASGRDVLLEWEITEESPGLKKICLQVSQPGLSSARPSKATFYYSHRLGF
ncbi:MAG: type IV pilus modification PilV family protein [Candidatus Saccharicenans sp.]